MGKCPKILYTKFSKKIAYANSVESDQTAPGPKILYTKFSKKIAYANSVDPDQTAPDQSDQGLHCLTFH